MKSFLKRFLTRPVSSDLPRINIGIFGKMNVGKSSLMNQITQHESSIVDSTPGTTSDVKVSFAEMHELGPIKLFDTPGTDEGGVLGGKKKDRAFFFLNQCDLVILVINPFEGVNEYDFELLKKVKNEKKKLLILYNVFKGDDLLEIDEKIDEIESKLEFENQEDTIVLNLLQDDLTLKIHSFIENRYLESDEKLKKVDPIPPIKGSIVFLNIPMDELTPSSRLLRPQAIVQEHCLRNFISTFCYRMNLTHARSGEKELRNQEEERFKSYLNVLKDHGCDLLITDSQAMDIVGPWTIDEETGKPIIDITTFSISMVNLMSSGDLEKFIEGIKVFDNLQKGDKVLIIEACAHNRIKDDIGTVQIPRKIKEKYNNDVEFDFAFGKGYQAIDLKEYKLAIHCGGCMLDRQSMNARIKDIEMANIPITNYGLLLSYFESKKSLERVIKPWLPNFDLKV